MENPGFYFTGMRIIVSTLLPIDETEPTGELNAWGEPQYRLTAKKQHGIYLKDECKMLVSQELYDKMKEYYQPIK